MGFHQWRTSFVILCPSIPDIGQMAPAPLLVSAGLVILRVHSESSCPIGCQMPSSDPLSSWWFTSCQWRASAWYQRFIWLWPHTNNRMPGVIYPPLFKISPHNSSPTFPFSQPCDFDGILNILLHGIFLILFAFNLLVYFTPFHIAFIFAGF